MTFIRMCSVAMAAAAALADLAAPARAQGWTQVADIPSVYIITVAADGDLLYAASEHTVYRSTDAGVSWTATAPIHSGTVEVATLELHGTVLYVGTLGSGAFSSNDGGDSWHPLSSGLTGFAARIIDFVVRGDSLFAGTDGAGIYVLNLANPGTWSAYNEGLTAVGTNRLFVSGDQLLAGIGLDGNVYVRGRRDDAWRGIPLNPPSVQVTAYSFQRVEDVLLAGASNGIYRGSIAGEAWEKVGIDFLPGHDVFRLTAVGNRVYAGVRGTQGDHFIASTDDAGTTWEPLHHEFADLSELIAAGVRLWAARSDGLWYYDLRGVPSALEASLVPAAGEGRGYVRATLEGNTLSLVGFFERLESRWGSIDLYRGAPGEPGELVENLYLQFGADETRGGFGKAVTLGDDRIEDLLAGRMSVRVTTGTNPSGDLSGHLNLLSAATVPLEAELTRTFEVIPSSHGAVSAALHNDVLEVTGYFSNLSSAWSSVDLEVGPPGEAGSKTENLLLNFGSSATATGFNVEVELSSENVQYLLGGRLSVVVASADMPEGELRGSILRALNAPPSPSTIEIPAAGEVFVIGGTGGSDPMDPSTHLMRISLAPAYDEDLNDVAYGWHLSLDPSFPEDATFSDFLGVDGTNISLTVGETAGLFDWLTQRAGSELLETPVTVYHRVLTTDGSKYVSGEASNFVLVRGTVTSSGPSDGVPEMFRLAGNYPNPFNPSTRIVFDLPAPAEVHVELYDVLGRRVLLRRMGLLAAGESRHVEVDASRLATGTYAYRLIARSKTAVWIGSGQLMLVK